MTGPSRVRRHAASPARVLALLVLVTVSVLGLFAVGLWMIAFAPVRWQRAVGQLMVLLAMIQMVAVAFIWRAWRAQLATTEQRR